MLAGRALPYTFLGTVAVAAALAPGTVRADDDAAVADQIAADTTRAIVASHFEDLTPAERRERARQTGHVRVTGAQRLSGRIIAESFTVERGAVATIEPGTVIWSAGDIRIDGPVVAPPKLPKMPTLRGGPGKAGDGGITGNNGTDAQDIIFTCDIGGDYTVGNVIQLADGQDGQSVNVFGSSAIGGNGGGGGGIIIDCPGTVTITANLAPGRGGSGGDSTVTGHDGAAGGGGENVNASCGGRGGRSGGVRIVANKVVFTLDQVRIGEAAGRIALRPGGMGGFAWAYGGKGADAVVCWKKAGSGGAAVAIGGKAGVSTKAIVQCKILEQTEFDAHDIASFDETESPDGGDAFAYGGDGGAALQCPPTASCPAVGHAGGGGGSGGRAKAVGGNATSGGKVGGGTNGILRRRPQAQAEAFPGVGGHATAKGGNGGRGVMGEDAQAPGAGGGGGPGGNAVTNGGTGGSSSLGKKFGQPIAGGLGPLQGGRGGNATSTAGSGGDGDDGGSCCLRSGGRGAPGGKGGVPGLPIANEGGGGFGFTNGDDGVPTRTPGTKGANGVRGEDCPGILDEFVTLTGTLPGPLFVAKNATLSMYFANTGAARHLKVELCCDGKVFATFFVDIVAGTVMTPVTTPSIVGIHIDSPHTAHHISVMVNGKQLLLFVVAVI